MARNFERNQPVLLQPANDLRTETKPEAKIEGEAEAQAELQPVRAAPSHFSLAALTFSLIVSAFWIGVWTAYLWGYLGPKGLAGLDLQQAALFGVTILMPPFLFIATAAALGRAHAMGRAAEALRLSAERLFSTDDKRLAHRRKAGPRRAP